MPELSFQVTSAEPVHHGMTPLLRFNLEVRNEPEAELVKGLRDRHVLRGNGGNARRGRGAGGPLRSIGARRR